MPWNLMGGGAVQKKPPDPLDQLLNGLLEFGEWAVLLRLALSLLLAVGLGALIAYHPRRRASKLDEVEQPKSFLLYALVGALVAEIVNLRPEMAFVIFGIGGLMRFRTDVGPARDTGRIILVTVVGLSCGLGAYVVAVFATAFGWTLIWILERRVAHRLLVKGLEADVLANAAVAYHNVLVENDITIMSEKKNFNKKQVAFVFSAPGDVDREEFDELFSEEIPPELQGATDWES